MLLQPVLQRHGMVPEATSGACLKELGLRNRVSEIGPKALESNFFDAKSSTVAQCSREQESAA
jgi:hypothetical protein